MILYIAMILVSAAVIIWVIRDGVKNPAEPSKRSEEYYNKVDNIFKVIITVVLIALVIGASCIKKKVERDLDVATKELMEIYNK